MLWLLLPLIFFFDFWYCSCFICCWVVALIVCILFLWFCLVVVVVKGWNQEVACKKTSAWRCSLVYTGRNSHISSRINYFMACSASCAHWLYTRKKQIFLIFCFCLNGQGGMDISQSTSLDWQLQSVDRALCCVLSVIACRCALAASALGIVNNSTRSTLISLMVSVDVKHHFLLLLFSFFFSFLFFFFFLSIRLIQRTLEGVVFVNSHICVFLSVFFFFFFINIIIRLDVTIVADRVLK